MANIHKQYTDFNSDIRLNNGRRDSLETSRNALRDKIKKYFKEEKVNELQPKFKGQGSFDMNTTVNPIPEYDNDGNKLLKYDLDYGVYFEEKEDEDNKRGISTWHDWVYNAVEDHTTITPVRKTTCVRVIFVDGHHIDLPIYYKDGDAPELAHRRKSWIESNPEEFTKWFTDKAKDDQQLRRIVRYMKAWRNYREVQNTNLKFPSGFALTILAVENFCSDDRDDVAFKKTLEKIKRALDAKFECKRPTTPVGENVFEDFSDTRRNDLLNELEKLIEAAQNAIDEKNFKKASEYLQKCFGDRFPLGKDEDEKEKEARLAALLSTTVAPKPYACED